MRLSIGRQYTFSSAHHLEGYDGPCARQHGHNYVIEITVSGAQTEIGPKKGMVMDYGDLDAIVKAHIVDRFDHCDLNEVLSGLNGTTTAENIAVWVFTKLSSLLASVYYYDHVVKLEKVRVCETARSWAEVVE